MKVYLFKLKFLAPYGLRVGGEKDTGNRLTVLRVKGVPTIPSTTWKGVLRSVSSSLTGQTVQVRSEVSKRVEENLGTDRSQVLQDPVNVLYGAEGLAGAITLSDSPLIERVETRYHVVIDRKSWKAMDKHLFQEELVFPGKVDLMVLLRVECDGVEKLWIETLRYCVDPGIFLGGGKSRGHGYITLDVNESQYALVTDLKGRPMYRSLRELIVENQ